MVAALLIAAPIARADGDPASDYLVSQSTFVPPELGITPHQKEQLDVTVGLARRRGFPIRVAIIGGAYDLGSVGVLAGKPQVYSQFLGQELAFIYRGRLLIVMPQGYGYAVNSKPSATDKEILDRLPATGKSGPELAAAAIAGVRALAAAHGVKLPAVSLGSGTSSHSRIWIWVLGGVLAAVCVVGGFLLDHRRRRSPG